MNVRVGKIKQYKDFLSLYCTGDVDAEYILYCCPTEPTNGILVPIAATQPAW